VLTLIRIDEDQDKAHIGGKNDVKFVIASKYSAEALESADQLLDLIVSPIE
jgi:hypothetical protein